MSLFEQTVTISHDEVKAIVKEHWDLELGELIKASQNHTFKASHTEKGLFAVRVTPDPTQKHQQRISNEVQFVKFVAAAGINHVCGPTPSNNGEYFIRVGDLVLVVFGWAKGAAIDFFSYRWMTEKAVVVAWGKWLAELHRVSRQFSEQYPDVAKDIQRWDQMHNNILAGSEIHPDDEAVVGDIQHYGVLHGDLNCSNFYFIDNENTLSVYDWDQVQRGWYLWDVAQSEITAYMLNEAGSLVDGSVVAEANPAQFEAWMIEGYESIAGEGAIDRPRLARMVDLRKSFYEKFCRKAQEEGDIPPAMAHFIDYVVKWFDKLRAEKQ